MWPRIAVAEPAPVRGMPAPVLKDQSIMSQVSDRMVLEAGLTEVKSRGVWQLHRKDVLAVREASHARTSIELFGIPLWRAVHLHSVSLGVDLRGVFPGEDRDPEAKVPRRGRSDGFVVSSVDWRPAASVAIEAVLAVHKGMGDD